MSITLLFGLPRQAINTQGCLPLLSMAACCVQVLITGSEATENYIMQIFTPPYLTGQSPGHQVWFGGGGFHQSFCCSNAMQEGLPNHAMLGHGFRV